VSTSRPERITVGDFRDSASSVAVAGLELELDARHLVAHWKRCGMTADFLASYLVAELEGGARTVAAHSLSVVLNELVENAAKFCTDERGRIRLAAHRHGPSLKLETFNVAPESRARELTSTLERLALESLDVLFARRVAAESPGEGPGIGLLIIKRDYQARLGAVLARRDDGAFDVHVCVELDVARLSIR
jgi:hypothetical protein